MVFFLHAKCFTSLSNTHSKVDTNKMKCFVFEHIQRKEIWLLRKKEQEKNNLCQLTKPDLYSQSEKTIRKEPK